MLGSDQVERMTICIGVDIGKHTAVAVWSENGLAFSAQGEPEEIANLIIEGLEGHNCPLILIEGVFVGVNPAGALELARKGGEIEGRLRQAGYTGRIDRPIAKAWRREIGFERRKGKRTKDWEEDARHHAAIHYGCLPPKDRIHEAEAICMAEVAWGRAYDDGLLGY